LGDKDLDLRLVAGEWRLGLGIRGWTEEFKEN